MKIDLQKREDEQAIQLAMFRYGVIAVVADREDRSGTAELVQQLAARPHYRPGFGEIRVSERTVWTWLRAWRQGRLQGLLPRTRSDRGVARVIDEVVLARAVALREDNEQRATRLILDVLRIEGALDGKVTPHRATLDRHFKHLGMSRRQRRILGGKRTTKLKFGAFGDLWVGDYHHGPLVRAPDGSVVTAKLGAFIDHATRYPVASRFYVTETMPTLRDTLFRALLVWGACKVIYVDNGKVYKSDQLAYSLDQIHVKLVHSRAYYSQGRGVIEKWWQVCIEFETEMERREELVDIHEMNRLWEAWQARYCDHIHAELCGRTPNEAIADVVPKPLDPEVLRELFLVRVTRKVNAQDACVSVEARRFQCESFLRGQEVEVRYDPNDLGSVLIFHDRKRIQRAGPQVLNSPEPHASPEPTPLSKIDVLGLVRDDFDRKLLEHARPLAYARLKPDDRFDLGRCCTVVADLAGIELRDPDTAEIGAFWDKFGPLPEDLVRIAVEHAVRLRGRGRHVRVYLHAVQTLVLAHYKKPPEKSP